LNEIHKLNEDQLKHFKQVFIENPGSFALDDLNKEKLDGYDREIAHNLLATIVDILSKKLPQDVNFNNAKLEQVVSKIKLVQIPKNI
jgi:hypothetical protein